MNKTTKWVSLAFAAGLLILGTPILQGQDKPGDDLPACAVMSWSPEVFTFYGDSATVLQKLQSIDRDLLKHRVFAFIVESEQGSHLSLFELVDQGSMRLGQVADASFDSFSHELQNTLLRNDGKKCAGMLAQDLISQSYDGELAFDTVSRPGTMADAFQAVADLGSGSYVRATFILLC